MTANTFTAQHGFDVRFEWGAEGLATLAPHCAAIVVVDVLRFTTAVSVAVERGVTVLPYRWNDATALAHAETHGAVLAGLREHGVPSLSPTDLLTMELPPRLVLPSPNGSTLSLGASEMGVRHVLAGSLRNASATADLALRLAAEQPIGLIAAGERWRTNDALRPAIEDLYGAGAVIAALAGQGRSLSPEALLAHGGFATIRDDITAVLAECASGRELIERGWADDVDVAAHLDASHTAALLHDAAFVGIAFGEHDDSSPQR